MFSKMLIIFIIFLTITFFGFTFNNVSFSKDPHYVGVKTCGMCHKKDKVGQQLKIWQDSQHSKAYKTLQTEEADKTAIEKGFTTKAADTPECLKCHASGYNVDASQLGKKFKIEDGVQCETCHGPGSNYKSKKVMKDRTASVKKGLLMYDNPEELCVKCHNDESPHFKDFNFEERWAKIKHRKPE